LDKISERQKQRASFRRAGEKKSEKRSKIYESKKMAKKTSEREKQRVSVGRAGEKKVKKSEFQ